MIHTYIFENQRWWTKAMHPVEILHQGVCVWSDNVLKGSQHPISPESNNSFLSLSLSLSETFSLHQQIVVEKDGNSYFSTLEIVNVAAEDAGKYKVTAKNELGESNATISLNFDSKLLFNRVLFNWSLKTELTSIHPSFLPFCFLASLFLSILHFIHFLCALPGSYLDPNDETKGQDNVKPTFTERPVIRQSDDGGKIFFECRLIGDPKPTVSW